MGAGMPQSHSEHPLLWVGVEGHWVFHRDPGGPDCSVPTLLGPRWAVALGSQGDVRSQQRGTVDHLGPLHWVGSFLG